MIITCEECTTRFKLDDARIPETGAKVRCSKCKHAFFVKPQASAGDPVEKAVAQALDNDDTDTKDMTSPGTDDLTAQGASETTSPGDSMSALRTPDDQSAQAAIDDFEESDWEFNTEEPAAGGEDLDGFQEPPGLALEEDAGESSELALDQAGGATSELEDASELDLGGDTGALDPAGDSGALDPAGDSGALDHSDSELDTQPHARGDAASEAVDDLLGGVDDDEEDLFDTSPGAVERGINALLDDADEAPGIDALLDEAPGEDIGVGPGLEAAPELAGQDRIDTALGDLGLDRGDAGASAPTASAAPPPAREELGDPGEWDIFGEERPAERAPRPVATQPLVIGRIGESSVEARPPVQVDPEPAAAAGIWGRRAAHGIGWAAVCALSALIFHQALWVAPRMVRVAPTSQQLAGLEATSIEGRWLENTAGGSIYVISGQLAGDDRSVTTGSRLAVRLLDAAGAPLVDEAADIGPELPMRALREESPKALRASQRQAAKSLAWQPFFPAQALRVAAVLEQVPAAAQGFELMAVPVAEPLVEAPPPAEAGE